MTTQAAFEEALSIIGGRFTEDQDGNYRLLLAPLPARRLRLPEHTKFDSFESVPQAVVDTITTAANG